MADWKQDEWKQDDWKQNDWKQDSLATADPWAQASESNDWKQSSTESTDWKAGNTEGSSNSYLKINQDESLYADPKAVADAWNSMHNDNNAASSWNATADTANGSWGTPQEAPAPPQAKAFWEMQQWNKDQGKLSRKEEWELEQDDVQLFTTRLGDNAGIDFNLYDSVPVEVSGSKSKQIPVFQTFDHLFKEMAELIPQALVENIRRCRYTTPTPVQKYAIPAGLVGRDVMCCAQTGSGKTAAFLVPVIGRMVADHQNPVGNLEQPFEGACKPDTLILTPTRELCIQIEEEAKKMCHRTPYAVHRLYGGEGTKIQMEKIATGADLLVACPGRLQDFIDRSIVDVSSTLVLVLDEADRMLDMGFEKAIRSIVENHSMPSKENRHTMMFSATFPDSCQNMAQDYLYDYIWIGVGVIGGAVKTVNQNLVQVTPQDKYEKLIEIFDTQVFADHSTRKRCLVFVNAKDTAKWLDEQLYAKSFDTGALHGNLTQEERETNLARFRNGEIEIMVATDVAARGLDIEKIETVINFDFPQDIDTYVHRIGRSGRIGNRGDAFTFVACDENGACVERLENLQKLKSILTDNEVQIPEWFDTILSGTTAGSWGDSSWDNKWGGKDVRGSWSAEKKDDSQWDGYKQWDKANNTSAVEGWHQ